MKKILSVLLAAVLLCGCTALAEYAGDIDTILTVITSPEQPGPQRPECFPDPSANYIPLPVTENFALTSKVSAGTHNDVYVLTNINDDKTETYFESKGFPAEIVFEMDGVHSITSVCVLLNPSSVWEPRQQEIAVLVSMDGEAYADVTAPALLQFDAATGNRVRIDFDAVEALFVKVIISRNTSARTGGAQAAEIQIY